MISFICAESFLSSCAIISSIVSSTSALMRLVSASACSTRVFDRILDLGGGALGSRLEALLQQSGELVGIAGFDQRLRGAARCCFRVGCHVSSPIMFRLGTALTLAATFRGTAFQRDHELGIG